MTSTINITEKIFVTQLETQKETFSRWVMEIMKSAGINFNLCRNQLVGFYEQNATVPQVFFKHFASKNQLPGLSISGTLVKNRLM